MRTLKYMLASLGVTLLWGCNYLDYNEISFAEKEYVFGEFNKTASMLTGVYNSLPSGFAVVGEAMLECSTDDAVFVQDMSNIHNFYNGMWSSKKTIDDSWNSLYTGIRRANLFLENIDDRVLEEYKWAGDSYQIMRKKWQFFRYEARFLRAFYHFELAKRYGDIPLLTKTLSLEEANSTPRTPFADVIGWIVEECTAIAPHLPDNYRNAEITPDLETGRATKAAALALKSRALLYLASPLHNPSDDQQKWIDAAAAAYELISSGMYKNTLPKWSAVFNNWRTNADSELILERRQNNTSRSFEEANTSIGFEGGKTGNCPTQNLVDAYEMKATGLAITEPGSGYDEDNPYEGRDPRMDMTLLHNGSMWKNRPLECFVGGKDGAPITYTSPTGYYLKKHMREETVISGANKTNTEHCWILFRYTEVLLNYAEAMNKAYGPDYTDADFEISAREAVNFVRSRPGVEMPDFPTGMTQEDFNKKIQNERRVELAFEGHRMWDLRRWKKGDDTRNIYKMDIRQEGSGFKYTKMLYGTPRLWEDKMYFYPIPLTEIYATKGVLSQNPGW